MLKRIFLALQAPRGTADLLSKYSKLASALDLIVLTREVAKLQFEKAGEIGLLLE